MCDHCHLLPAESFGVDTVGVMGGSFNSLCWLCDKINDLLWQMADISRIFGSAYDAMDSVQRDPAFRSFEAKVLSECRRTDQTNPPF